MAIKSLLAEKLVRAWRSKGTLAAVLLPIAWAYQCAFALRRFLYQRDFFSINWLGAKVVVVGNVVAGGAGKTPTVIAIAQHLAQRGIAVGVVSRGYGRAGSGICNVQAHSNPSQVGDEPLLIFTATGCPVFVGEERFATAHALLAQHPQVRVILCDDGLQHYALYRDLEVCVFDDRGTGNGWQLPAGPLREPWPRKWVAKSGQAPSRTLVLHTGSHPAFEGYRARRALKKFAVARDGTKVALAGLEMHGQKPLFAVAGLAQPDAFFDMLRALDVPLAGCKGLPDHFDFADFDTKWGQTYQLLCTEKDAAKLWRVVPDALAVPLEQTMESDFWAALDAALGPEVPAPLSSADGHKTT